MMAIFRLRLNKHKNKQTRQNITIKTGSPKHVNNLAKKVNTSFWIEPNAEKMAMSNPPKTLAIICPNGESYDINPPNNFCQFYHINKRNVAKKCSIN